MPFTRIPDATDDDYMHAAELEAKFAEYDGYTAEARAGELLLGIGIAIEDHAGPMSNVAPGWKLRVLLAQALFSKPDVLLLDEPTNNLDITSIRWLEDILNQYNSTMVIISHDRHFLNQVCTHMADMDFGTLKVYPGNYDDYMLASAQARERQANANQKAKDQSVRFAGLRAPVLGQQVEGTPGDQPCKADRKDQDRGIQAVVTAESVYSLRLREKAAQHRSGGRPTSPRNMIAPSLTILSLSVQPGERIAIIGENGAGKTTLAARAEGRNRTGWRHGQVGGKRAGRLYAAGHV